MTPESVALITASFWKQFPKFLNCPLETELPHPLTQNLSREAQTNLLQAIQSLKAVDQQLFEVLFTALPDVRLLAADIATVLNQGGRIFILGCGASGRLALELMALWSRLGLGKSGEIVGVIAGGDVAAICPIEEFEDRPELGFEQLTAQGFEPSRDLLIAASASGESPFIVEAVVRVGELGRWSPWFLACNSREVLLKRDPGHLCVNPAIKSLCLGVGPMALTGSTRLQATTALWVILYFALRAQSSDALSMEVMLIEIQECYAQMDLSPLLALISAEADSYGQAPIEYRADLPAAFVVLSDLAERGATFNIPSFSPEQREVFEGPYSFAVADCVEAEAAWNGLLHRKPVCLEWQDYPQTQWVYLKGFSVCPKLSQSIFEVQQTGQGVCLKFENQEARFDFKKLEPGLGSLILKLILNIHSTLVMGRLGRYEGNLMTCVSPNKAKLLDRAIRTMLLQANASSGKALEYRTVAEAVLKALPQLQENHSLKELLAILKASPSNL